MLVDIGANLTHPAFRGDLDAVLARARSAGVAAIVVTGTTVGESRAAAALAAAHEGLFATAGVHPHHAREWTADAEAALRAIARAPRVVAIGECGLDFHRDHSPRPDQEACFVAQLELAAGLAMPLFLHSREAHPRFAEIVRAHRPARAVAHCFTGTREELHACLDLDLHIGITGWICDERRGRHLVELVREIPAERLLVETDAPYLVPRDLVPQPRKRRNEPAFLPHIVRAIARARGQAEDDVAAQTARNARALFSLDAHESRAPSAPQRALAR